MERIVVDTASGDVKLTVEEAEGATTLILASTAPSTLPYPDARPGATVGPCGFHRRAQRLTWDLVRRLVSTDIGLKLMLASLSRLPARDRWSS